MIRSALPNDAGRMADILVSAWQTAYQGIVDPNFPPTLDKNHFSRMFESHIRTGKEIIFVCEETKGDPVGFISGKIDNQAGRVIGFYVHPSAQGRGAGTCLLDAMKTFFREKGCSRICLETLDNAANNRFYRRQGGNALAGPPIRIGEQSYPGLVFEFDLSSGQ